MLMTNYEKNQLNQTMQATPALATLLHGFMPRLDDGTFKAFLCDLFALYADTFAQNILKAAINHNGEYEKDGRLYHLNHSQGNDWLGVQIKDVKGDADFIFHLHYEHGELSKLTIHTEQVVYLKHLEAERSICNKWRVGHIEFDAISYIVLAQRTLTDFVNQFAKDADLSNVDTELRARSVKKDSKIQTLLAKLNNEARDFTSQP